MDITTFRDSDGSFAETLSKISLLSEEVKRGLLDSMKYIDHCNKNVYAINVYAISSQHWRLSEQCKKIKFGNFFAGRPIHRNVENSVFFKDDKNLVLEYPQKSANDTYRLKSYMFIKDLVLGTLALEVEFQEDGTLSKIISTKGWKREELDIAADKLTFSQLESFLKGKDMMGSSSEKKPPLPEKLWAIPERLQPEIEGILSQKLWSDPVEEKNPQSKKEQLSETETIEVPKKRIPFEDVSIRATLRGLTTLSGPQSDDYRSPYDRQLSRWNNSLFLTPDTNSIGTAYAYLHYVADVVGRPGIIQVVYVPKKDDGLTAEEIEADLRRIGDTLFESYWDDNTQMCKYPSISQGKIARILQQSKELFASAQKSLKKLENGLPRSLELLRDNKLGDVGEEHMKQAQKTLGMEDSDISGVIDTKTLEAIQRYVKVNG